MTDEELLGQLKDEVVAEGEKRGVYINLQTVLVGLMPALYAVLTFIYGDRLWTFVGIDPETGLYGSAFEVPYAPESWGFAFLLTGAAILALGPFPGLSRYLALACYTSALLFLFFSASFVIDAVQHDVPPGWPPAIAYFMLASHAVNRGRLAWVA